MQVRKEQPPYAIMTKAISPTFRQSHYKRQSLQPNQIFLMDFADTRERYQIKKKRYPLFLVNRVQKKKNGHNNSVFTSQGILLQAARSSEMFTGHNCKKKQSVSKMKSNSFVTKKQTLNSAFNFTKTFSPKKVKSIQCTKDFTPFRLYPQGRFLQSAHTNRQQLKLVKRRSNSTQITKEKSKTEGNQVEGKQIGAWRTIDVEFEQLI